MSEQTNHHILQEEYLINYLLLNEKGLVLRILGGYCPQTAAARSLKYSFISSHLLLRSLITEFPPHILRPLPARVTRHTNHHRPSCPTENPSRRHQPLLPLPAASFWPGRPACTPAATLLLACSAFPHPTSTFPSSFPPPALHFRSVPPLPAPISPPSRPRFSSSHLARVHPRRQSQAHPLSFGPLSLLGDGYRFSGDRTRVLTELARRMVVILLSTIYLVLLYTLYIPDWKFEASSVSTSLILNDGAELKTVSCGVRGSLCPACNAVGFIDRLFLGEEHLYQRPVYRRTKECSTNSPDYGPLPTNAPVWCLAPFDPEGILSSLMAAVSCFIGMHFGNLIVHTKGHNKRMFLWLISSLIFLLAGYTLKVIGVPLSKPLYTMSYALVTAGVSGLVFTVTYFIVDVRNIRSSTMLLQWMGMNAFLVYALAACELFPAAIQGFYLHNPENNLVNVTETKLQEILHSESRGTMAFVLLEIIFWCLFAGFLNKKGIYIKL